jgi:acyl-lipid omega-6 desaturase (Delta-12 desaturase)
MSQPDQILSVTKAFQAPILASSLGQLATSFGGFFATCTAMYLCLAVSLWITLPMSVLAAGFLIRISLSNMIADTARSSNRAGQTS